MPLLPGKENIGHNISEMEKNHPRDQAIAAALNESRKHMAKGGMLSHMRPLKLKNESMHTPFHGGLLHGPDGGRTDTLKISVPHSSYVLPADIVSNGFGEGNTTAGGKILDKMFGGAHGGMNPVGKTKAFASGGYIPIITAGGEYVVHPAAVKRVGKGSIKAGHQVLDKLVEHMRKKSIKEVSKLPGPK